MEPTKDDIGVNILVQVLDKFTEDSTLLSCSVSSHPQPASTQLVVDEKDITFLEPTRKHNNEKKDLQLMSLVWQLMSKTFWWNLYKHIR